jgi:hypothetical protein
MRRRCFPEGAIPFSEIAAYFGPVQHRVLIGIAEVYDEVDEAIRQQMKQAGGSGRSHASREM